MGLRIQVHLSKKSNLLQCQIRMTHSREKGRHVIHTINHSPVSIGVMKYKPRPASGSRKKIGCHLFRGFFIYLFPRRPICPPHRKPISTRIHRIHGRMGNSQSAILRLPVDGLIRHQKSQGILPYLPHSLGRHSLLPGKALHSQHDILYLFDLPMSDVLLLKAQSLHFTIHLFLTGTHSQYGFFKQRIQFPRKAFSSFPDHIP